MEPAIGSIGLIIAVDFVELLAVMPMKLKDLLTLLNTLVRSSGLSLQHATSSMGKHMALLFALETYDHSSFVGKYQVNTISIHISLYIDGPT